MKTALIYDPLFLKHNTGSRHPEQSERLSVSYKHLSDQPWFDKLVHLKPQPAPIQWIESIHDSAYIQRVKQACAAGEIRIDTPDVRISADSYDVAMNAAGSLLDIADRVVSKQVNNGFAMVRPPGHHAETAEAMGFCLFNSVAIAARYLQQHHGLERVLILDWDVHHGNGTQHTFERDPSVFYLSLHEYPHYPGTGAKSETGIGPGEGATLNCPMSAGMSDADYREAFDTMVIPAVRKFGPDAILLSAGFDAHRADPLSRINLLASSYRWMTDSVMSLADECCEGRLISVLEGGYDYQALAESVTGHLEVLSQNLEG